MSQKMGHSTWSCLGIHCLDPLNVYLCFVWSQIQKNTTVTSCFGGDMAAHCGRQWAHQFYLWYDWYILFTFWHSKYLLICLMGTYQKMRHTNSQYWWRYCHLLSSLLSTVSKTCCILTESNGSFNILTWWVSAYTYKEYVPKNVPQNDSVLREILQFLAAHHHQQWAAISQSGKAKGCYFHFRKSCHWMSTHYIINFLQFPFWDIWPWEWISEYFNEISTKHCHTTIFRKPLTMATKLIDPEVTLKIYLWISQSNQHQTLSCNHI